MNNSNVPIIADGKLIKSHTEYVVLNKRWKLVEECSLSVYLSTLKLDDTDDQRWWPDDDQRWWPFVNFSKIQNFYLRQRTISDIIKKKDVKNDPWNRQFIVYPPEEVKGGGVYTYYNYYSKELDLEVVVVVTTVNRSRVYCVDVIK